MGAVFADMMSKANVSHAAEAGRPSGALLSGPRRGLRYWLGVVQAWARGHLSPLAQRSGLPRTSSMRDRTRATREPHLSAHSSVAMIPTTMAQYKGPVMPPDYPHWARSRRRMADRRRDSARHS